MSPVDIAFLIVCLLLVGAGVGIYFLIPVLNKKQNSEQRENLRKREEIFKRSMEQAQLNKNKKKNTNSAEIAVEKVDDQVKIDLPVESSDK